MVFECLVNIVVLLLAGCFILSLPVRIAAQWAIALSAALLLLRYLTAMIRKRIWETPLPPLFFRKVPLRDIVRSAARQFAIVALIFGIKALWLYGFTISGEALFADIDRSALERAGGPSGETVARRDLMMRRDYLAGYLEQGSILSDMPDMIPEQFKGEWAIVTYAMLASVLGNLSFTYADTRSENIALLERAIEQALSAESARFDRSRWSEEPLDSLDSENGHIGYLGELNWMLGAYKYLGGGARFDGIFDRISSALFRRMKHRAGGCLETYPGETYVADNVVVAASLANYSRLHANAQAEAIRAWVDSARTRFLDPETGLMSFLLDDTCRALGGSRGSGAAWNSFYLPFIDEEFAKEQWNIFRDKYTQNTVITGFREYPRGVTRAGDIDSGPLLFGLSPAATGFGVGGAMRARDLKMVSELLLTAELAGSTVQWNGRRFYALAPVVGEAILLAMKTARPWDERYVSWSR